MFVQGLKMKHLNRTQIITGLLIGLAITSVTQTLWGQPDAKPEQPNKSRKRADVATRVFELRVEAPLAARDPVASSEETYVWSKRWMEAELQAGNDAASRKAAADAHFSRMTALEERVQAKHGVGAAKSGEVEAAAYYRLEAEELRDAQAK